MRVFLVTMLAMAAFAGNSVLNRLALKGQAIGALDFAAIRLVAGAVVLVGVSLLLRHRLVFRGGAHLAGAAMLLTYMVGFSSAYLALDAGTGALILFGGVQITMFAGAVWGGERVPLRRWLGAALACVGLGWLLWPAAGGDFGANPWPLLSMALAAVGWGIYSLLGRESGDALATTAANFVLAAPVAVLVALAVRMGAAASEITPRGVVLAVVSGGITSGFGYALWYAILPKLGATRAAVAQLSVPVIALLGGMAVLAEAPSLRLLGAVLLVMGGVAVATLRWPLRPGAAPR